MALASFADGGVLGSLGAVAVGNWYELDVTPLVTGDGPVSVRITSSDPNGADYSSKEHTTGNAPYRAIRYRQCCFIFSTPSQFK